MVCMATYRKVPPENSNTQPTANSALALLPRAALDSPRMLTADQVRSAPTGAASEKMIKCVRASRVDKPCFNKTDVRPKAAGALHDVSTALPKRDYRSLPASNTGIVLRQNG